VSLHVWKGKFNCFRLEISHSAKIEQVALKSTMVIAIRR